MTAATSRTQRRPVQRCDGTSPSVDMLANPASPSFTTVSIHGAAPAPEGFQHLADCHLTPWDTRMCCPPRSYLIQTFATLTSGAFSPPLPCLSLCVPVVVNSFSNYPLAVWKHLHRPKQNCPLSGLTDWKARLGKDALLPPQVLPSPCSLLSHSPFPDCWRH